MERKKINEIKTKLRAEADNFFASIQDVEIRKLFEDYAFIAGGAIASSVMNETPHDYDFYFKDSSACHQAVRYFLNEMGMCYHSHDVVEKDSGVSVYVSNGIFKVAKNEEKYQPIAVTANAFTFTDGVQFIIRYAGIPDQIVKKFDFVHSKGIYDYKEDKLVVTDHTLEAIESQRITFTGSDYPLASLIRTRKFVSRGWHVNAGQYLKIALQLNTLDLMNPEVLREQLVGVDIVHFASFLDKISEVGIENIELNGNSDKLFDLIDKAFALGETDPSNDF